MEVVVPPFESFYEEHKDAVFAFLRRRLGRTSAEDAFQDTFLRALRAYDRLEHGRQLRAWVFRIATNVAMDEIRTGGRSVAVEQLDGEPVELRRPAFTELEHLTGDLPPKERAAVVLRYGYD